jgi:hypothetical protein
MKKMLVSLAVAGIALSTGAAFAQNSDFTNVDTNRDNTVSWPEFQLICPDISEEAYKTADVDGDGTLNLEEFDSVSLSTGSITARPAEPNTLPMDSLTHVPATDSK